MIPADDKMPTCFYGIEAKKVTRDAETADCTGVIQPLTCGMQDRYDPRWLDFE